MIDTQQTNETLEKAFRYAKPFLAQMIMLSIKINHLEFNTLDQESPKFKKALKEMEFSYKYYNDLLSEVIKNQTK